MATRSRRGPWRWIAVAGCLVCSAVLLTGSTANGEEARALLRALQMNLCNSGLASCYTGRAVAEAAVVIRATTPDLVTLNEVCRNDVSTLERTLSGDARGGVVVAAFEAAADRRTGGAFRCRNGQEYGIGLLARIPPPYRGYTTHADVYPIQDTGDPEERAWLCLDTTEVVACTTHLASTKATVALAQCRYLLDTGIPAVRGQDESTVLGGDFNLRPGRLPSVRSCLPFGYVRADDGGTQDIVASAGFTVTSRRPIGMHNTTDHPGLLVTLGQGRAWRRP